MNPIMFHNPRCSKSRATLDLLQARDVEPNLVLYLEDPPDRDTLRGILRKLGVDAPAITRFRESAAKELGLAATDDRTEDEWLDLLVRNPILIQRPIVVQGDQAAIGRPPENVLALFEEASAAYRCTSTDTCTSPRVFGIRAL